MSLPGARISARPARPDVRVRRRVAARRAAPVALAAALLAVGATPASADTLSSSFVVRTRVFSGCTLTTNNLFVNVARQQTDPALGSTTFRVVCGGATATNPLPVRFTFAPASGGSAFILRETNPTKQMPYDLCNDAACAYAYSPSVEGPPISVTSPVYSYDLYARVYPPPTGATPGNYRQQLNVTLAY